MPSNIIAARVPLTDPETGLISREWYNFFYDLFTLTGSGQSDESLIDLQLEPPIVPYIPPVVATKSGFRAYRAGALSVAANAVIIMDTIEHSNIAGEYDTTTGAWTATVSGWYVIDAGVALVTSQAVSSSLPQLYITKNGTVERYLNAFYPLGTATGPNLSKPTIVYVTAGEVYKVVINVSTAPAIVTGTSNTWFSAVQLQ